MARWEGWQILRFTGSAEKCKLKYNTINILQKYTFVYKQH